MEERMGHINEFIADRAFEAYKTDLKAKSAFERPLQILNEAAIRLGEADGQRFIVLNRGTIATWAISSITLTIV
jgi:hypothetical protein